MFNFYFIDALLSIRKATPADIPLVRELAMQIWPQTYTPIIGPQQVAYMLDLFYAPEALQKQMDAGQQFILCYDDGEAVAFASYAPTKDGIYKLHKLYILPGMQGRGIGRFMIDYIVKELKSIRAAALQLNVNRYNKNAIGFYEKTGFKRLHEEDIDIGNGYFMNDYVLSLAL